MALNTRLFVGNLPENLNEDALKEAFSSYGEITNFDLKCKPGLEADNKKRFAFISLIASNFNVESCIKYFSNEDFQGNKLYVTRARESFLERLQREREQLKNKNDEKFQNQEAHLPIKKNHIGEHRNTHKRKFNDEDLNDSKHITKKSKEKPACENFQHTVLSKQLNQTNHFSNENQLINTIDKQSRNAGEKNKKYDNLFQNNEKKQNSDKKRQESIKKKRQEFNEKKNIIKIGLVSIDKQSNKKIIFSDNEEDSTAQENPTANGHIKQNNHKPTLFDDGGSDDEINFEVKKQYEGKKGQKVLDLQSRYKSDKRFVLDERFVEDSESEKDDGQNDEEEVDLNQADEKSRQLNTLQDLLGVTIKSKSTDTTNKTKTKLGMLRFDPTQPEHAKYLVPVTAEDHTKKSKKKKSKEIKDVESQKEPEPVVEKVEVSKEQFYKISDSLKETMTQPTTFSLRSLFTKEDDDQQTGATEDVNYIPLPTKKDTKVKNPMEPSEKNPFVYDSSESENEEDNTNNMTPAPETNEIKTVWREKLFFSKSDHRLKDGLIFFGKPYENGGQKERRELKSLMKKRIYNKERKNTMFQKKIGGRKKSMRQKFRN
ncbi:nucleolar protein 8 [Maniola jurtina]|uniref:nucleolar protein 8 n=1 Tax=Maniola jurtina TaxID=191418 RepID=UPI001E68E8F5|nr:nucleolar protein 8 [Maniola jurtina]